VEDNSVATASFDTTASQLLIESEAVIQQYNEDPLDFLVDNYALHFPFPYTSEDLVLLAPYRLPRPEGSEPQGDLRVSQWLASIRQGEEAMQTYALLQRISDSIQVREWLSPHSSIHG
jgi:hypothetical protein